MTLLRHHSTVGVQVKPGTSVTSCFGVVADGGHELGAQRADDVLHLLRAVLPHVLLQQHGRMDTQGARTILTPARHLPSDAL